MPNFLEYLKSIGGLFGPQQQVPQQGPNLSSNMPGSPLIMNMNQGVNPNAFNDVPPDISQMNIGNDPYAGLRELYQPEHRYTDMMEQMLNQFPKREKPSLGRRVVSSMVAGGKGGIKEANAIMEEPYTNQLNDWKMRFDPLVQLANQERYNNSNSRQFASTVIKDQADQEKLNEIIRNNKAKNNISAFRAQSYDELNKWKMNHPNFDKIMQPDGNILLLDKNSGDMIDTGTPSHIYNQMELLEKRVQGEKEVAGVRGAESRKTEMTAESNREKLEGIRQTGREKLVQERAATRAGTIAKDKQLSVSQDAAAWKLARQQHIADNPSHAVFWDPVTGLPTGDAEDDDTGTYEAAVNDMRERYNRIKARATNKGPTTSSGKPAGSVVPSNQGNKGTPPPIEQRQEGMQWTFPNGNIGKWNAKDKKWEKVVTR